MRAFQPKNFDLHIHNFKCRTESGNKLILPIRDELSFSKFFTRAGAYYYYKKYSVNETTGLESFILENGCRTEKNSFESVVSSQKVSEEKIEVDSTDYEVVGSGLYDKIVELITGALPEKKVEKIGVKVVEFDEKLLNKKLDNSKARIINSKIPASTHESAQI